MMRGLYRAIKKLIIESMMLRSHSAQCCQWQSHFEAGYSLISFFTHTIAQFNCRSAGVIGLWCKTIFAQYAQVNLSPLIQ